MTSNPQREPCPECGSGRCFWIASPLKVECVCAACGPLEGEGKLGRLAVMLGPAHYQFDLLVELCEEFQARSAT